MADPAVAAAARVAAMAAAAAAGRTFTKGEAPLPSASKRELGDAAVWSCSSAKPGNGVELLRDDNTDTFWQSDGAQPHVLTISFQRKVELLELALYCDVKADESYTPRVVSVRAGNSLAEMKEVRLMELDEPGGWVTINLVRGGVVARPGSPGVKAYVLQVVVVSNHQNGRDTHVRQCKVYGPRINLQQAYGAGGQYLTTVEFSQYATVR